MVIKAASLRAALKVKGFEKTRNTTDELYYLYCDGRKTSVFTKVSHGRGEDLRDVLIQKVKKQLGLQTTQELTDFVECPLTLQMYTKLLKERGRIKT